MPRNLSKRKLLIISDTAVRCAAAGSQVYEPAWREIDAISDLFDEIVWLGCNVRKNKTVFITNTNTALHVIVMPSVNRKSWNAVFVLFAYPVFILQILKHLSSATHVHTRAPSHPAWIAILLSRLDKGRKYWHKYAGNWMSATLPFTYRSQMKALKKATEHHIKITVNGRPGKVNANILSFENPCFSEKERVDALEVARKKDFSGNIKLLFVGGLDDNKGIIQLLDAIADSELPSLFTDLYIIGDGPLLDKVKQKAISIKHLVCHVIGIVNRTILNQYYRDTHLLILPSSSEGFPKVVAEAAAFGCIPLVTNVSSLSQYISHEKNGFLIETNTASVISQVLKQLPFERLKEISTNMELITPKFTYEYFRQRVKNEIYNIS